MKRLLIILIALLCSTAIAQAQFSLYLEDTIPLRTGNVTTVEINPTGRFLAIGDSKGNITVWDLGAKRQLQVLKQHRRPVTDILFDSKTQRIVSAGKDGKVVIWDIYSGKVEKMIKDFGSPIHSIALSPDDRMLAAGGQKKEIYLWEFPLGSLKAKMKGHKKDVLGLAFHVNGDQVMSVAEDKLMIVWNVNTQSIARKSTIEARVMRRSGIDIKSAAFSFDRSFVGVGINEHVLAKGGRSMIFKYLLAFYDWNTGSEIEIIEGNRKDIEVMTITPDKNYVITDNSTLRKNQISFWNIRQTIIEQNYPIDGRISAMAVSEDGKWISIGYQDPNNKSRGFVNVWQVSGMDGFQRFDTGQDVATGRNSGFGASIKITTPAEPLISFGSRKKLAVLYFDSPGLEADIARTTSYLLEGKLANSPFIDMVERNQIQNVLDELRFQQTGLTTSNAVEVGKHLNAEYILIGSINKLGTLLIITSKLVNVETAQIEGTREVQCKSATIENISDMVSALAPTIAKY